MSNDFHDQNEDRPVTPEAMKRFADLGIGMTTHHDIPASDAEANTTEEQEIRDETSWLDTEDLEIDGQAPETFTLEGGVAAVARETQHINSHTVFVKMREYAHFSEESMENGMMNLLFEADAVNRDAGDPLQIQGEAGLVRLNWHDPLHGVVQYPGGSAPILYENGKVQAVGENFPTEVNLLMNACNDALAQNVKRQVGEIATSLKYLSENKTGFLSSVRDKALLTIEERRERVTTVNDIRVVTQLDGENAITLRDDIVDVGFKVTTRNGQTIEDTTYRYCYNNATGEAEIYAEGQYDLDEDIDEEFEEEIDHQASTLTTANEPLGDYKVRDNAVREVFLQKDAKHFIGIGKAAHNTGNNERTEIAMEHAKAAKGLAKNLRDEYLKWKMYAVKEKNLLAGALANTVLETY